MNIDLLPEERNTRDIVSPVSCSDLFEDHASFCTTNRQLIEQIPEIFRSSGRPGMKVGTTGFLLSTRPLAAFSGTDTATGFREVQDGTGNTVMAMYTTVTASPTQFSSQSGMAPYAL